MPKTSYKFAVCPRCNKKKALKEFYNLGSDGKRHHKRKFCNACWPDAVAETQERNVQKRLEKKRKETERRREQDEIYQYQMWLDTLPTGHFKLLNPSGKGSRIHPAELYAMYTLLGACDPFSGEPLEYNVPSTNTRRLELDHIVPIQDGGTSELSNLIMVTRATNVDKRHMPLDIYLAWRYPDRAEQIKRRISWVHDQMRKQGFIMDRVYRNGRARD